MFGAILDPLPTLKSYVVYGRSLRGAYILDYILSPFSQLRGTVEGQIIWRGTAVFDFLSMLTFLY